MQADGEASASDSATVARAIPTTQPHGTTAASASEAQPGEDGEGGQPGQDVETDRQRGAMPAQARNSPDISPENSPMFGDADVHNVW